MSPILTGTKDSLLAFVTAKLPKTIDAKLPPTEMLEAVEKLNTDLAAQLKQKKRVLDVDSQARSFYVYLDKDARSLSVQKSSIRSVAEEQLPKLAAGLKMLDDKSLSSLPDTLVACTRAGLNLNNNFAGIVTKLNNIDTDINEKDSSLDQLKAELKELDIAAGKDSKDFEGQLNKFDAKTLSTDFGDIQEKIKAAYKKLRDLSLSYQKDTTPLFAGLKTSVNDLTAKFNAMTKDLDTTVEALKTKVGEDKVAWQAVKDQHEAIGLLLPALEKLSGIDPSVTKEKGTTEEEFKTMPNPDDEIKAKKDKAVEARKPIPEQLEKVSERLTQLTDALTVKANIAELIEKRSDELDATNKQAKELSDALSKVDGAIRLIITKVKQYTKDLKVGSPAENILTVYMNQLKLIDEKGQSILDLNAGISQVKSPGDIKLYFGEIASILDQFPVPAKAIMDGILNINSAMAVLAQWAEDFKTNLVGSLKEGFEGSSWNIVEGSTNSTVSVWTDLKSKIGGLRIEDEDLRYVDKNAKTKQEIIPIKSWTEELKESIKAIDKQEAEKAIDKQEAKKDKEALQAMIENADKLGDWETFYTEREAKLKANAEDLAAEITFLNKFLEQEA